MVLVSREDKKKVYSYLFKEGVLTVKKDGFKKEHDDIKGVHNLHVMMVMKSLASRDLVKFIFNWRWFYYYLTDDGIKAIRDELHLPSTAFPATLTKQAKGTRGGDAEDRKGGKGKGKGKGGKGGKGKGWGRERGYQNDGEAGGAEKEQANAEAPAQAE